MSELKLRPRENPTGRAIFFRHLVRQWPANGLSLFQPMLPERGFHAARVASGKDRLRERIFVGARAVN